MRQVDPAMNQDKFASLVGLSKSAINAIESRGRPLSPNVALTIGEILGANPVSLLPNPDGALNQRGQPYSRDDYEEAKKKFSLSPAACTALLNRMARVLALLLERANGQRQARMLEVHFYQWVDEILEKVGPFPRSQANEPKSGSSDVFQLEELCARIEKRLGQERLFPDSSSRPPNMRAALLKAAKRLAMTKQKMRQGSSRRPKLKVDVVED